MQACLETGLIESDACKKAALNLHIYLRRSMIGSVETFTNILD